MEIYIPTRVNPARLHTPALLKAAGITFTLVVDNKQQAKAAQQLGYRRTMITPNVDNLAAKRTAISAQHGKGWYISMDDNICSFACVAPKYMRQTNLNTGDPSTHWRGIFNVLCSPVDYLAGLMLLQQQCSQHGTVYGGVATMENPFFRGGGRYATHRFVKGKVYVMDAGPQLVFKHSMVEDSYMTALVLAHYGCVVVDKRMFYRCRWYEPGGHGNRLQREQAGLLDRLQDIVNEFPGLVAIGRGNNTALRVLRTSTNGVNRWRREHGYL